jgi:uncharacterized protein (DUF1778 family)
MTEHMPKDDTLKLRMDSSTAALLETARGYLKLDKSKFIRQSIREKAEAVIASHEQTRFSERDWDAFLVLLDKPAAPTTRMKAAVAKYRQIIEQP